METTAATVTPAIIPVEEERFDDDSATGSLCEVASAVPEVSVIEEAGVVDTEFDVELPVGSVLGLPMVVKGTASLNRSTKPELWGRHGVPCSRH